MRNKIILIPTYDLQNDIENAYIRSMEEHPKPYFSRPNYMIYVDGQVEAVTELGGITDIDEKYPKRSRWFPRYNVYATLSLDLDVYSIKIECTNTDDEKQILNAQYKNIVKSICNCIDHMKLITGLSYKELNVIIIPENRLILPFGNDYSEFYRNFNFDKVCDDIQSYINSNGKQYVKLNRDDYVTIIEGAILMNGRAVPKWASGKSFKIDSIDYESNTVILERHSYDIFISTDYVKPVS
jgi:hypothetical protein